MRLRGGVVSESASRSFIVSRGGGRTLDARVGRGYRWTRSRKDPGNGGPVRLYLLPWFGKRERAVRS
ncbi:hypothetical protein HYQ44_017901 [Verticillium longisporum]|nr:hypothetical protein HYQ44_017901 [Verticillium longisporum]